MTRRARSVFRRGFAATLVLDVVSRTLSAGAAIVLIRALGSTDYAYYVLFLALGQFIGSAATGGVRMRYLRDEAERVSRGGTAPSAFRGAWLAQSVIVVALVVGGFLIATAAGIGSTLAVRAGLAASAGTLAFAQSTSDLVAFHEQAHLRFASAGRLLVVRSVLLVAVATLAVAGLTSGAAIAGLTAGVLLIWSQWLLLSAWQEHRLSARSTYRRLLYSSESGWLTVYYFASAGYATIDILVISSLMSSMDVATFGAAQRYYAIALGAIPALTAVLRVRTSQASMVDSLGEQREMLMRWVRTTAVPAAVLVVVAVASAGPVIGFIDGSRYPSSVAIFRVMMLAVGVRYVLTAAPNILMAQRRFRPLALALVTGLALRTVSEVTIIASGGSVFEVACASAGTDISMTVAIGALAWRGVHSPRKTPSS